MIQKLQQLMELLNTRAGSILILWMSTFGLFLGIIHMLHHADTGEASSLIRETFAGFSGALLMALTSGGRTNTENKNIDVTKTTTIAAEVTKV